MEEISKEHTRYVNFKTCPICDCKCIKKVDAHLIECMNCSHRFRDYFVGTEKYSTYRSSAHGRVMGHLEPTKIAAEIRIKLLDAFGKKGSVLEIGSAHKYFLDELIRHGYHGEGTELSELLVKEIPYTMYLGEPSEIPNIKTYDNICAFHVLEHMNEPLKEISYLVNHMSDDGVMILELPTLIFRGLFVDDSIFEEALHTNFFTQTSLNIFAKNCGLKIAMQINYRDIYGNSITTICCVKESRDDKKIVEQVLSYLNR